MIDVSQLDHYKKIAYNLYTLRMSKKWTQEYLSNVSGVERSKISRIENYAEDFLFFTILRLAKALDVSYDVLLIEDVTVPEDFINSKEKIKRAKKK